jgi:hypothetical protein
MPQRTDLETLCSSAFRQIALLRFGGEPALALPASCPVTLDQLLTASVDHLEAAFSSTSAC